MAKRPPFCSIVVFILDRNFEAVAVLCLISEAQTYFKYRAEREPFYYVLVKASIYTLPKVRGHSLKFLWF